MNSENASSQRELSAFGRCSAYAKDGVWEVDPSVYGFFRRMGVQILRFFSAAFQGFVGHSCGLHAAGLTYFTMLSLVPIICLVMVLAKTCGVDGFARTKINEQIDAIVLNIEKGQEATVQEEDPAKAEAAMKKAIASKELAVQVRNFSNDAFDRIEKFSVRTLGWVGLGMLLWTVISTLGQVETSMNEIWLVPKARSFFRKAVLYLFIVLILPWLVALAMSMPILRVLKSILDATLGATSYTKWAGDALIFVLDSRLFSWGFTTFFSSCAFAFLLKMIPNRKVSLRASLESGVLTAVLFTGWFNLCTTAGVGIAKTNAMYGSCAAFPIILAWIYMSWQIVLLGSCFTYAFQCVHSRTRLQPVG